MYGVSASCSLSSSPMEEFHIQVRRMRCCCDAPTSNISLTKWQMQIQIQMRRDDKCRSSSPSGAWLQDGKPPKLSSGLVRHHARMLAQGIKEPTSTVIIWFGILPIFAIFLLSSSQWDHNLIFSPSGCDEEADLWNSAVEARGLLHHVRLGV